MTSPDRDSIRYASVSDDESWDRRIFALVPSGIDVSLIDENLKLTPSARLDKLTALLEFIEEARQVTK